MALDSLSTMDPILIIHVFTTFFMCGLIWLIQLVHYPSFAFVAKEGYPEFQRFHMLAVSWIVLPVMLIELLTGAALWYLQPSWLLTMNVVMLLLIWGSTITIQMPVHAKLEKGYDESLVKSLVRGNWVRTILWSARCVILAFVLSALQS